MKQRVITVDRVMGVLKAFLSRKVVIEFDKVKFRYANLTWKRILNWFLCEMSYVFKVRRPWGYPTLIQIEPVRGCNLRCPQCYVVSQDMGTGQIRQEDFRKLVDEVSDYTMFLHFWGWGEPFLSKDMFEMISYAKSKGLKIITSTNGHYFDDDKNVNALLDSGLDTLIFAVDGVDQESYEKYRTRGDFERVMRGLRALVKKKRERNVEYPTINLRMVVTKDNEDQIDAMKALASEVEADCLSLKTIGCFGSEEGFDDLLPSNPAYHRYRYDKQGKPIRKKNLCRKMWNHPVVFYDGQVSMCDYALEVSLGNVFENGGRSFGSIWFGDEYADARVRFMGAERNKKYCQECGLNFADHDDFVSHIFSLEEMGSQ